MTGFKYVACVHLCEDVFSKDYYFALYDSEYAQLIAKADAKGLTDAYVVVNARNKMCVGKVLRILPVSECTVKVSKEVVCVMDMRNYTLREDKRKVLSKLQQRKRSIAGQLDTQLKQQTAQFYRNAFKQLNTTEDTYTKQLIDELEEIEMQLLLDAEAQV